MSYGNDPLPELDALLAQVNAGELGAIAQACAVARPRLERTARMRLAEHTDVALPDLGKHATTLVDKVYLRLFGARDAPFLDSGHFLAAGCVTMHLIMKEGPRRRRRRRG